VRVSDTRPKYGLKIGDIGMALHIYADHKGYEDEFVTLNSKLIALVSVCSDQICQLEQGEVASARNVEMAQ